MAAGTLRLAETHGPVLSGRAFAAELADEATAEIEKHGVVVLDFEGVDTVSPSFADELFGKLVARLGSDKVRFAHLSPHLAAVAKMAQLARKPAASRG